MPSPDLQRKYRYSATFIINSSGEKIDDVVVDDFTPPTRRAEPFKAFNRTLGGEYAITGPVSYGELTLRVALRIGETLTAQADLLGKLEALKDSDADTIDVSLNLLSNARGVESDVGYAGDYLNCRLTGLQIEALGTAQEEMAHVEITLQPSRVQRLRGTQLS